MSDRDRADCCNCGRKIYRLNGAGGTWVHTATASSACYPGKGSRKYASPVEVSGEGWVRR